MPNRTDMTKHPDMGKRPVYAIGDIHGRLDLLDDILGKITHHADGKRFKLIFLGDYIDRGPDSWGVIERLIKVRKTHPSTVFLKGNHEQVMIDFLAAPEECEQWLDWGGIETLRSYGVENIRGKSLDTVRAELADLLPDEHFRFLMDLTLSHQIKDFYFVHAGVHPDVVFEGQSEEHLLWIREPFLRNTGYNWQNKTIVHGHTPVESGDDAGWRINVDTGAYASGVLTAVCLEGRTRTFLST